MSDLYIQVKDGLPINHPVLLNNLLAAFGNIPSDWEPFERIQKPSVSAPKILDSENSKYEKVNGVWTDVWNVRDMNVEELRIYRERAQRSWDAHPDSYNFTAWIFNEITCEFEAPIPRPLDGKHYKWSGSANNWLEAPLYPQAGGEYIFDFRQWVWVPLVLT